MTAPEQVTETEVGPDLTASEARKARQEQENMAAESLVAVYRRTLSDARMDVFCDLVNQVPIPTDARTILGRYWLGVAGASALCPALHYLEIALRNSVYNAVGTEHVGCKGETIDDCWLDLPRATTILRTDPTANDFGRVHEAKFEIGRKGRPVTAGRIIAEMPFGFWVGLLSSHYGYISGGKRDRLWPRLLPLAFPHMPAKDRTRECVSNRLHVIRLLRNSIFHHEPIWGRRIVKDIESILETIGWIDPVIQAAAEVGCKAFEISNGGVDWYKKQAVAFAMTQFPQGAAA